MLNFLETAPDFEVKKNIVKKYGYTGYIGYIVEL